MADSLDLTLSEIGSILGRNLEFQKTTLQGVSGFVPLYINYNFQPSSCFSETELGCAKNFLSFLKSLPKEETDE